MPLIVFCVLVFVPVIDLFALPAARSLGGLAGARLGRLCRVDEPVRAHEAEPREEAEARLVALLDLAHQRVVLLRLLLLSSPGSGGCMLGHFGGLARAAGRLGKLLPGVEECGSGIGKAASQVMSRLPGDADGLADQSRPAVARTPEPEPLLQDGIVEGVVGGELEADGEAARGAARGVDLKAGDGQVGQAVGEQGAVGRLDPVVDFWGDLLEDGGPEVWYAGGELGTAGVQRGVELMLLADYSVAEVRISGRLD